MCKFFPMEDKILDEQPILCTKMLGNVFFTEICKILDRQPVLCTKFLGLNYIIILSVFKVYCV